MLRHPDLAILALLQTQGPMPEGELRERIGEGFDEALAELVATGRVRSGAAGYEAAGAEVGDLLKVHLTPAGIKNAIEEARARWGYSEDEIAGLDAYHVSLIVRWAFEGSYAVIEGGG